MAISVDVEDGFIEWAMLVATTIGSFASAGAIIFALVQSTNARRRATAAEEESARSQSALALERLAAGARRVQVEAYLVEHPREEPVSGGTQALVSITVRNTGTAPIYNVDVGWPSNPPIVSYDATDGPDNFLAAKIGGGESVEREYLALFERSPMLSRASLAPLVVSFEDRNGRRWQIDERNRIRLVDEEPSLTVGWIDPL